jgi:hypothetical protein
MEMCAPKVLTLGGALRVVLREAGNGSGAEAKSAKSVKRPCQSSRILTLCRALNGFILMLIGDWKKEHMRRTSISRGHSARDRRARAAEVSLDEICHD